MSTWCCHMKGFFFFSCSVESLVCQFRSCFFCVVAWSFAKSNQLAAAHSDDNKSRHYHFNWGPSSNRGGEREIFLSGGRITYDPFMSRWEPLKIIIHHSRGSSNNWKAPSVINLMGFAYFFSFLTRIRQEKSHKRGRNVFLKTLRSSRVHIRRGVFLHNSLFDWKH